jgi:hypothetical protein
MKKSKKTTNFGGNFLYTKTVRPNKNYGKFVKKDGETIGDHKFIKLDFMEKSFHFSEDSNIVVCKLSCRIKFNIPQYWENTLTEWTEFDVKGIAICSEDDKFNLDKGIAIASAKAEIEAYNVAKRMLKVIKQQMDEFSRCLETPIENFKRYATNNIEFINKVVDGKIKIKPKHE